MGRQGRREGKSVLDRGNSIYKDPKMFGKAKKKAAASCSLH